MYLKVCKCTKVYHFLVIVNRTDETEKINFPVTLPTPVKIELKIVQDTHMQRRLYYVGVRGGPPTKQLHFSHFCKLAS